MDWAIWHTFNGHQLTPFLQSSVHTLMADTAVIHYILEEVNVDYKMLDLKSSFFNNAGSRPWDKGGPQSSRPFDGRGGGSL